MVLWTEIRRIVSGLIPIWPDEIMAPFTSFKDSLRKLDRARPAEFSYSRQLKEEKRRKRQSGEEYEKRKDDTSNFDIGGFFGDEN